MIYVEGHVSWKSMLEKRPQANFPHILLIIPVLVITSVEFVYIDFDEENEDPITFEHRTDNHASYSFAIGCI